MASHVHVSRRLYLCPLKHEYPPPCSLPLPAPFPRAGTTVSSLRCLTGSGITFVYAFRQMGQPLRYHGRRFHDRCVGRVPPYLGCVGKFVP